MLVEGVHRLVRILVEHVSAAQRVVGDDQAAVGELRKHRLVVVDVAGLVRVDEDEVERAVELRDRLDARTEPVLDAIDQARLLGVALRDRVRLRD